MASGKHLTIVAITVVITGAIAVTLPVYAALLRRVATLIGMDSST